MSVITRLRSVFGGGPPRSFVHPEIGELTYDGVSAWRTSSDTDLLVSFYSSRHGPDEQLFRLASSVWSRLRKFEDSARLFIASNAPSYQSLLGRLGGVDFLFPNKEWIKQQRAAVQNLTTTDPIFALCFMLNGDRNVLDVVFVFEKPVLVDYH